MQWPRLRPTKPKHKYELRHFQPPVPPAPLTMHERIARERLKWRQGIQSALLVALNEHIGNPDLIHTYRPGDLTPDFVMLPVPPEKPATDTPPATPKAAGAE